MSRPAVDMSPEMIERRLRDLGQLYRLGLSLATARRVARAEDLGPERFGPLPESAGDSPDKRRGEFVSS